MIVHVTDIHDDYCMLILNAEVTGVCAKCLLSTTIMQESSHTVSQEVAREAADGECASSGVPHIWRQAVC